MNLDDFSRFRTTVDASGVIFYFSGTLTQHIIAAIGDSLRARLAAEDVKGPVARKVFSTFIEMMQNIVNYAENPAIEGDKTSMHLGSIAIGERDNRYYIVCGNRIGNEHVERVRGKLERVRAMSLDEIKQEYKAKLRQESEATSKGAGLGFLTVARDASEPIEFSFLSDPADPERISLFFLKATI
jgi:hypothetical protein